MHTPKCVALNSLGIRKVASMARREVVVGWRGHFTPHKVPRCCGGANPQGSVSVSGCAKRDGGLLPEEEVQQQIRIHKVPDSKLLNHSKATRRIDSINYINLEPTPDNSYRQLVVYFPIAQSFQISESRRVGRGKWYLVDHTASRNA